ncbi:MAG: hypothetical protein LBD67_01690 [Candidatus Accumulibacter sp.]|nr:hypothetical protein [Accumulibacter sp.]
MIEANSDHHDAAKAQERVTGKGGAESLINMPIEIVNVPPASTNMDFASESVRRRTSSWWALNSSSSLGHQIFTPDV